MDNLLDNLGTLIEQYPAWRHAILAAGIILQGEITVFVGTYLIAAGNLSWIEFIGTTSGTLIVAESILFFVGRALRTTRLGWRFYKKIKHSKRIQSYAYYLKNNLGKLLIVTKFLPATNLVLLLATGWIRTPFGKFMRSYLLSVGAWFLCMILIGHSFASGLYYLRSQKIFEHVEWAIGILAILVLFGERIFRKMINRVIAFETHARDLSNIIEEPTSTQENADNNTTSQ